MTIRQRLADKAGVFRKACPKKILAKPVRLDQIACPRGIRRLRSLNLRFHGQKLSAKKGDVSDTRNNDDCSQWEKIGNTVALDIIVVKQRVQNNIRRRQQGGHSA